MALYCGFWPTDLVPFSNIFHRGRGLVRVLGVESQVLTVEMCIYNEKLLALQSE